MRRTGRERQRQGIAPALLISGQLLVRASLRAAATRTVLRLPAARLPRVVDLADDDPRKTASLYSAAEHWALRLEMNQEALAAASRDISALHDWGALGTELVQRRAFYDARPWLQRAPRD